VLLIDVETIRCGWRRY